MTGSEDRAHGLAGVPLPDGGALLTAADPGWDAARTAWNVAVDQRPAAVAQPASARDVRAVMNLARDRGLRVAAQGTGHNPGPLAPLDDTILVRTDRIREVRVDPGRRVARAGAGAPWLPVVQAAAEHGLAGLAGSSPDVGVAGYTLGGGVGFLGRQFGLACNSVEAVELVTADGEFRRVDADHEPDLFWAVRGGGGSFGVVTALEFRLFPVREVYAGILWWPIERGAEVLHAWRAVTQAGPPEELTTLGRYLQLPPLPELPEPVRGRSFVVVEVIHLGPPAEADALLAPLRALGPVMDTIATIPAPALSRLHMDPEHPVPAAGDGFVLAELPAEAIEALVRVAGAGAGSPLLSLEVRQLDGAFGRAEPDHGALPAIDGGYALYGVGIAPTPEAGAAMRARLEVVRNALAAWAAPLNYLNFVETACPAATLWTRSAYERLCGIKARVDPTGMIRANHSVPGANTG